MYKDKNDHTDYLHQLILICYLKNYSCYLTSKMSLTDGPVFVIKGEKVFQGDDIYSLSPGTFRGNVMLGKIPSTI